MKKYLRLGSSIFDVTVGYLQQTWELAHRPVLFVIHMLLSDAAICVMLGFFVLLISNPPQELILNGSTGWGWSSRRASLLQLPLPAPRPWPCLSSSLPITSPRMRLRWDAPPIVAHCPSGGPTHGVPLQQQAYRPVSQPCTWDRREAAHPAPPQKVRQSVSVSAPSALVLCRGQEIHILACRSVLCQAEMQGSVPPQLDTAQGKRRPEMLSMDGGRGPTPPPEYSIKPSPGRYLACPQ